MQLGEAAAADLDYCVLREAVIDGFPNRRSTTSRALQHHWPLKSELSTDGQLVLYGSWIVVPAAARPDALQRLHASHQGIVRTKQRARQVVYWPGMIVDIERTVRTAAARPHVPLRKCQRISFPMPATITSCMLIACLTGLALRCGTGATPPPEMSSRFSGGTL